MSRKYKEKTIVFVNLLGPIIDFSKFPEFVELKNEDIRFRNKVAIAELMNAKNKGYINFHYWPTKIFSSL